MALKLRRRLVGGSLGRGGQGAPSPSIADRAEQLRNQASHDDPTPSWAMLRPAVSFPCHPGEPNGFGPLHSGDGKAIPDRAGIYGTIGN
jgi:hypothetical protein